MYRPRERKVEFWGIRERDKARSRRGVVGHGQRPHDIFWNGQVQASTTCVRDPCSSWCGHWGVLGVVGPVHGTSIFSLLNSISENEKAIITTEQNTVYYFVGPLTACG